MATMKCKRCSFTCRSIKAMGDHYRKAHPQAMKRGREDGRRSIDRPSTRRRPAKGYCRHCGMPL